MKVVSVVQEVMVAKDEQLYDHTSAAIYLGIPVEKFLEHTNYKASLAYVLISGRRLYRKSELDRFKKEVLSMEQKR